MSRDSASCVIFNNHEDSSAVLQGFAITAGTGTKWNDEHAAGIYREGGGILIQYSYPVIQNNIIYNNQCTNLTGVTSTGGGGMRIGDSYSRIYNNIIFNNTGTVTLKNSLIASNIISTTNADFDGTLVSQGYNLVKDQTGTSGLGAER